MLNFRKEKGAGDILKNSEFKRLLAARFNLTLAIQMLFVVVGWQVYEITKDPLSLGFIGLSEAVAFFIIAPFSGHMADIISRKKIITASVSLYLSMSLLLLYFSIFLTDYFNIHGVLPIYFIMFMIGIARGMTYPSVVALIAQVVPRELYAHSAAWNSLVWHIAAVTGPALGGLVYGFIGLQAAYFTVACFTCLSIILFTSLRNREVPEKDKKENVWESISSGVKFVFKTPVLLGAMSLDMFGVMFGGAVALLPVFAADILHTGPEGLGFLRAAPAIGSVMMSLWLAYHIPRKNAGRTLLFSVAGFGLSIIMFALSKNFYLSAAILIISGMFDNVSVVIRNTAMQLYTPDNMRGRVAAVNSIFLGSSNEIGAFESGAAARLLGLVPSVIFGGCMTVFVVLATAKLSPSLRKLDLKKEPLPG